MKYWMPFSFLLICLFSSNIIQAQVHIFPDEIGIGVDTPSSVLHIIGDGGVSDDIIIEGRNNLDSLAGAILFYRTAGTVESPLPAQEDNILGVISWRGFNGTEYIPVAEIEAQAAADFMSPSIGSSRLVFKTSKGNGAGLLERMRITRDGKVGIGTTSPDKLFHVEGISKFRGRIDAASIADENSIFIGKDAGLNDDGTSNANTFIGFEAGRVNTSGDFNTAIGNLALNANTIGENNTSVGHLSLADNTEGESNTAMGFNALGTNLSGSENTAVGLSALSSNKVGERNTAIGRSALGNNNNGNDNTAVGYNTLAFGSGSTSFNNTAVGTEALFFNTASNGTAVGYRALYDNSTGGANTAIGNSALVNNTFGAVNTAIGDGALIGNTTGNSNTAIGGGANVGSGDLSNATAVGANARVDASNSLILGNNVNVGIGTSDPAPFKLKVVHGSGGGLGLENNSGNGWQFFSSSLVNGNLLLFANFNPRGNFNGTSGVYTSTSDRRLKQNIKILEPVLEKVMQLEPSRYQFIDNNPKNEETIGLIAQDVETLFPEFVFESEDEQSKGLYTMDYSGFGILAIKAIQEQQEIIEAKEQRITNLEILNKELQDRLAKIESVLFGKTSNENNTPNITITDAKLYDNQPNPFTESTTLRYFIPKQVKQASLQITDANGAILKVIEIAIRGEGQTTLEAQALSAGNYFYSLVLDGKVLETKQMVLVE